eukprot:1819338-Amphidinium_carterae.1
MNGCLYAVSGCLTIYRAGLKKALLSRLQAVRSAEVTFKLRAQGYSVSEDPCKKRASRHICSRTYPHASPIP